MKKIVIFGGTSAMAMETARLFAEDGCELLLIDRDQEKLEAVEKDLAARGAAGVSCITTEVSQIKKHNQLLKQISETLPDYDTVLIAYGTLSDEAACRKDFKVAEKELGINFLSVASLLTRIASDFEAKKSGTIAVISSCAGDRGRQSNYVYGTAKGALTIFLQGLRNRLYPSGVQVVTIKPGFVDTPMTAHLKKGLLFVKPAYVAKGIYSAIMKGKDSVYVPFFWRAIMIIICSIPECVFKRLKL